jgi:UDP-2,3-diacylglucosamine hydrolase
MPNDLPMIDAAEKYGLIAGNGKFPFLVLESARRLNLSMVVAAIKEETFPEIETCGFPVHWLGLGQLGKLVNTFKSAGVTRAIMAGQVKHVQIFSSSLPDLTMIRMLAGLKQKNTDALIGGIARILEEKGITLIDSTALLGPYMAAEGKIGRRDLSAHEQRDVSYGRPLAQQIARMDIGQTIIIRDKAVVAVEAMEGTDAAIRRAAELVQRKNLTVIKVSKPRQDMRFDVPVTGVATIRVMADCGATAIVLDAGKTLLLDRDEMLELADKHGIAIVGMPPDQEV